MKILRQHSPRSPDTLARNAFRVSVISTIACAMYAAYLYSVAFQVGTWDRYAGAAMIFILGVVSIISAWLSRHGRSTLGMTLLLGWLLVVILESPLRQMGHGLLLGLIAITLTSIVAFQTLPRRRATQIIAASVIAGAAVVLLDTFGPADRPPFAFTTPLLIVTGVLVVIFAVMVARQFNSYMLRTKLLIAFLAVSLISVAGVAFYTERTIRATLSAEVGARLKSLAELQATAVGDLISKSVAELQAFGFSQTVQDSVAAANTSYQGSPADIQAEIDRLDRQWREADRANDDTLPLIRSKLDNPSAADLREFRGKFPDNVEVFVTDRYGAVVAATNRTSNYNQAGEAWWQAAYNSGQGGIYVGQPEFDASSATYATNIAVPVYAQGTQEVIGVLRTTLQMKAVISLLAKTQFGRSGSPDLLLPDGTFLQVGGSTPASNLLAQLRAAASSGATEMTLNGVPQFVSTAPVKAIEPEEAPAVAGLNWTIVTHQPSAEALAPVEAQARSLLFFAALIAGVMAIAAIGVSRLLIEPISHLTAAAEKVGQGDLTAQATVESTDEIGILATTFNGMTAQLRGIVGSLEERVQARTAQLRASADVGRAATSILNTDELLHEVVNLITERFGFYYAAIFLIDEANEYAVLRAATGETGRTLLERGHRLPVKAESMVGTAILSRRPRIALDAGQEAVRFANPLLPNTRSEIALPLRVGNRVLGALDVQSEQGSAFDEASAEVLQNMADQVAVALFNADIFKRAEQQTHTLTELNHLSRNLAQATSLESIALATGQAVANLTGSNRVFVAVETSNPQLMSMCEYRMDNTHPLGESQAMPVATSLAGECWQGGKVIYTRDINRLTGRYDDAAWLVQLGLQSSVTIPLRAGERSMGAFSVASGQLDALPPEQIDQLERVATQLAIALENMNLVQQTRQAVADLDAANRRLIGQAWAKYTRARRVAATEWRSGEWITYTDPNPLPVIQTMPGTTATAPLSVSLPIKVRGETIGEFNVMAGETGSVWSKDDLAFAQALIDQVGQVIENARLLEDTERLAQRERTINEINSRVRQTIDLDAILKTAVDELGQSLQAARVIARVGSVGGSGAIGSGRGDDHG